MRRAALICLAVLTLAACGEKDGPRLGYAEGDYRYLSPREAGLITTLNVREGDRVAEGAPLFSVDADRAQLGVDEAAAQLQAAKSRLADLQRGGRAEEIKAAQDRLQSARADLELAQAEYNRARELVSQDAAPQRQLDEAERALGVARARVQELASQAELTALPAREGAIQGAQDDVDAAQARLELARRQLDDRSFRAPAAGVIQKIFRRPGEAAAPNAPVVSLLPDDGVRLIFFAPESDLANLHAGDSIDVACDGCASGLTATIDFISTNAEYTPPVIFSEDERSKLVFRIEATPENPGAFHPGQPVQIRPNP